MLRRTTDPKTGKHTMCLSLSCARIFWLSCARATNPPFLLRPSSTPSKRMGGVGWGGMTTDFQTRTEGAHLPKLHQKPPERMRSTRTSRNPPEPVRTCTSVVNCTHPAFPAINNEECVGETEECAGEIQISGLIFHHRACADETGASFSVDGTQK